jgi:ATP-dependent Clp protease adapter protein ClpS
MTDTAVDITTKVKINTDLKPPTTYSVFYFNDDKTSMDFVVISLVEVFGYGLDVAMNITQQIHEQGSGAVKSGISKELATHLRNLVISKARAEGFPLTVEIQEDVTTPHS